MTPAQLKLKKKHGTPDEFAQGCLACLGEISYAEMQAAVAKYDAEWKAAGNDATIAPCSKSTSRRSLPKR